MSTETKRTRQRDIWTRPSIWCLVKKDPNICRWCDWCPNHIDPVWYKLG